MILMLNTDWFHEDDDSDENESKDENGGGVDGVDGVYDEVNVGEGEEEDILLFHRETLILALLCFCLRRFF